MLSKILGLSEGIEASWLGVSSSSGHSHVYPKSFLWFSIESIHLNRIHNIRLQTLPYPIYVNLSVKFHVRLCDESDIRQWNPSTNLIFSTNRWNGMLQARNFVTDPFCWSNRTLPTQNLELTDPLAAKKTKFSQNCIFKWKFSEFRHVTDPKPAKLRTM